MLGWLSKAPGNDSLSLAWSWSPTAAVPETLLMFKHRLHSLRDYEAEEMVDIAKISQPFVKSDS